MWISPLQAEHKKLWSEAEFLTFAFLQNDQNLLADIKLSNFNTVILHVAFIICHIRLIEFCICPPSSQRKAIQLKFQAQIAKTSPLALQPSNAL